MKTNQFSRYVVRRGGSTRGRKVSTAPHDMPPWMCASWRRSASCPCDAFDARVLHLAAQTPTATPIETRIERHALLVVHTRQLLVLDRHQRQARLLALAHCRGLDRWQVRHKVQIAALLLLLLLLESIRTNGCLVVVEEEALGWLGRRQASHTIAHTRTRRARAEREEVRAPARQQQTSHCSNTTQSLWHSLRIKLDITLS